MCANSAPSRSSFVVEHSQKRSEYLTEQLIKFNQIRQSPLWSNPPQPSPLLQVFALDDQGSVISGLIGKTNQLPEWLQGSTIWVAEETRGQGPGDQLYGKLENCPRGKTNDYFCKELIEASL